MSDATTEVETPKPAVKPKPRPMLVTGTLQLRVTATAPASSPWGDYTASIAPFNRLERAEYFDATGKFVDKDDRITDTKSYQGRQVELLTPRIKSWDAEQSDLSGNPIPAPINQGTVAALPPFAFEQFLTAALGGAGVLGN